MKRSLLLALSCLMSFLVMQAQKPQALKKVMELKMPKTAEDEKPGRRGASVAWHPLQKKYYAVFAGNEDYPLAVFDEKGKRLSDDDLTAMMDSRGLWYDPKEKTIGGNGFNDVGWFTYKLDKTGIPNDVEFGFDGMNQPDQQCVGAYMPLTKQILFLSKSQVYVYDGEEAEVDDSIQIHWSRKKSEGPGDGEDIYQVPEDYNYTTVVYTGTKGQELGFLNITNKQIELYDIKTGFLTKTLGLPDTATAETTFNFAYANGIYWLFNMDLRKWVGYK